MSAFVWDADPELLRLGSFALRWYSLLFAGGFIAGHWMLQRLWNAEGRDLKELDVGLVYVIVATIAGARLAHCLFYDPEYYLSNPLEILKVWTGGLASHGGFAAVFATLWYLAGRFRTISFLGLIDRVIYPTALVAAMIRVGNFFNSEIIGRPWDGPLAIVFKKVDLVPRHAGQLYEAAGYFALCAILGVLYWRTSAKERIGTMTGVAFVLSTAVRIGVEALKENQSPFEANMPLNMGQLLSIPFMLVGIALLANVQARIPWLVQSAAERRPPSTGGETEPQSPPASRKGQKRKRAKQVA